MTDKVLSLFSDLLQFTKKNMRRTFSRKSLIEPKKIIHFSHTFSQFLNNLVCFLLSVRQRCLQSDIDHEILFF